jgi:hypothetical protein
VDVVGGEAGKNKGICCGGAGCKRGVATNIGTCHGGTCIGSDTGTGIEGAGVPVLDPDGDVDGVLFADGSFDDMRAITTGSLSTFDASIARRFAYCTRSSSSGVFPSARKISCAMNRLSACFGVRTAGVYPVSTGVGFCGGIGLCEGIGFCGTDGLGKVATGAFATVIPAYDLYEFSSAFGSGTCSSSFRPLGLTKMRAAPWNRSRWNAASGDIHTCS